MLAFVLAMSTLCASGMTIEKAEQYQAACRLFEETERARAAQLLKDARVRMAKAKKSGTNIAAASNVLKKATTRVKDAKRYKGEPLLSLNPTPGNIGVLDYRESRNFKVLRKTKGELIAQPYIVGSVANASRTPVEIPLGDELVIKADSLDDGVVYEVISLEEGRPVLEVFDVEAARRLLEGR